MATRGWRRLWPLAVLLGTGLLGWSLLAPGEGPRQREAKGGASSCGTPGESRPALYGKLREADLPWSRHPPDPLLRLRHEAGATTLMAGFRTTLPDPILDERYNIALAARRLAGQVVPPGGVFSQNEAIGPYTRDQGFREGPSYVGNRIVPSVGGGVCKISSTLYNVAVFANLPVLERHPHSMLVPYVPPGRDATVSYGVYDFRFQNTTGRPIVIWADTRGDDLYIAFYGGVPPPRVRWEQEILSRQPTWEVRRPNPELAPGTEKVVVQGAPGVTVRTWVVVDGPDGRSRRRDLGVDTYRPMPRVIEYGPPP